MRSWQPEFIKIYLTSIGTLHKREVVRTTFPFHLTLFLVMCMCESFCEDAHMRLVSCIEYKRVLDLLELVL